MKKYFVVTAIVLTAWVLFHHPEAHWEGRLAPDEPVQISDDLRAPWLYKDFTITARAKYHIRAVILSKHHYWGWDAQDTLSSYDLALGWGRMSEAGVVNQLNISQGGRWYHYHYSHDSPLDPAVIESHSSNNHIIAGNQDVLEAVEHFKRYDLIDLSGYLVDIRRNSGSWNWHTSLSRTDTGDGSCEVFWVTSAYSL